MDLAAVLAQARPFFDWIRQSQPHLCRRADVAVQAISVHVGVPGCSACIALRDGFHVLFVYASDGGFSEIAALFYQQYVLYCRLLLSYPTGYGGGGGCELV